MLKYIIRLQNFKNFQEFQVSKQIQHWESFKLGYTVQKATNKRYENSN